MSTISERVAAAFKAATGEDKAASGSWHVRPIFESSTCGGLRASKDGNEVQVYSSGEVRGHDDVAVRFAREAFEVALERAQAS